MKPFLGIDLTTNKKNEQMNGEEFLVAKPSSALTEHLERTTEDAQDTVEKSMLPLPFRIVQWICGIGGVIIIVSIVKALCDEDSVTISEAYQNASWLFWLGGLCLLIWGILKLISLRREKNTFESDEGIQAFSDFEKSCDAIYSELSVPTDSKEVDILSFYYKVKQGKIKVCEKGMQVAPYINPIYNIFTDSENLYLANLDGKYAFPLTSIKAIRRVKKTINILEWNKDEPHNKGYYKQFKLAEANYGEIICKCYYIMEIERGGETHGIYIPNYELPVFEELTGLKAQEEE